MTEELDRKFKEARQWYTEHLPKLLGEYGNDIWFAISTYNPQILDHDKNFSDLFSRIRDRYERGFYILINPLRSKDASHLRPQSRIDR